eukprot:1033461-Pleurochrysis_carterae.AAC.1
MCATLGICVLVKCLEPWLGLGLGCGSAWTLRKVQQVDPTQGPAGGPYAGSIMQVVCNRFGESLRPL